MMMRCQTLRSRLPPPTLPPTNRYFTVEIRDTNDVLREVLFGPPGPPWTTNWTTRSLSLSRYLGETIRLVWKEEASCIPIATYLDDIALQVSSSIPTTFDLY